jgi:hypothetical protein
LPTTGIPALRQCHHCAFRPPCLINRETAAKELVALRRLELDEKTHAALLGLLLLLLFGEV